MATGDPKPWHRPAPDALTYRASPVRVILSLSPLFCFLLAGGVAQYALQGNLSPGMDRVYVGAAIFALVAALVLPRVNHLEFTPEHFLLRELFTCKQVKWSDIEPGSITYVVRTIYWFPLFTNIGFRVRPSSPYHTAMRILASAATGMHVYFVNMYPIGRDEMVETLRRYQTQYGTALRRVSEAPAVGFGANPVEPVLGDSVAPGPKYDLVVMNDDTHTFGYVIQLLQEVLGVPLDRAQSFTLAIDQMGCATVFRGPLDEVTRKRDRILAYGPDASMPGSTGPLDVQIMEVRCGG